MTRETDDHGWKVPVNGRTKDWGTVLLGLFDDLDSLVPLVGPESEFPAADSVDVEVAVDPDAGAIFRNTGSSWDRVADVTASEVSADIESHRTSAVHDAAQPPQSHGNAAHSTAFSEQGHAHSGETITPNGVQASTLDADKARINEDAVTIHVPSDYDTVQEALTSNHVPLTSDIDVEIVIESGHAILEPIHLRNGDWGNVLLDSEDETVPAAGEFPGGEDGMLIERGARGPTIRTVLDWDGVDGTGINIRSLSSCVMRGTSGSVNAGSDNVTVTHSSAFSAYQSQFYGAGDHAVRVRACSACDLGGAGGSDLSGASDEALYAEFGAVVRAYNADLTDSGNDAMRVINSRVVAPGADCSNPGRNGIYATEGRVEFEGGTINNGSDAQILADTCSVVNCEDASIDGGGGWAGVSARESRINARGATVLNNSTDLEVDRGGILSCNGATTTNSTGDDPHENDMNVSPNSTTAEGIIFADSTEV